MAIALTIAGASKSYRKGTLKISAPVNGRSTASFAVRSNDGTYRPAMDAEVIITEGATRIFGGVISKPSESGTMGDKTGDADALSTSLSAVDFNTYTERRFVNETLVAGTLKSMLTTLVANYLTEYGITLDAGQVDGPTFPALDHDYVRVDGVLNELSNLTSKYGAPYVWRVDHFKVLSMFQPSTNAAPFNVTDGDGNTFGDITVESVRDKRYANKVIVKVLPKSEFGREESFTGDGTDGPFTLTYTPTKLYGHILLSTGGGETLGVPPDSPIQWSYDPVTNSITRDAGNTTVGTIYTLYFDGVYSGVATASDAAEITARKTWEKVLKVESVPSDTTAQAFADAELARSLPIPQLIRYKTKQTGILPGQSQTITCAKRNLSAVASVITNVEIEDYGKGDVAVRSVTATSGTTPIDDHRAVLTLWAGDKTGGGGTSVIAGSGGSVSVGPAPPLDSVQFHDVAGAFGGDEAFTFLKTQHSVICGDLCSITAADHEGCQVFGYNNHIGDP